MNRANLANPPNLANLVNLVILANLANLVNLVNPVNPVNLVFLNRLYLTSTVITAVGADAVRRFRLVAVRALAEADGLECVVRPAFCRARLGMTSFGIGHSRLKLNKLYHRGQGRTRGRGNISEKTCPR